MVGLRICAGAQLVRWPDRTGRRADSRRGPDLLFWADLDDPRRPRWTTAELPCSTPELGARTRRGSAQEVSASNRGQTPRAILQTAPWPGATGPAPRPFEGPRRRRWTFVAHGRAARGWTWTGCSRAYRARGRTSAWKRWIGGGPRRWCPPGPPADGGTGDLLRLPLSTTWTRWIARGGSTRAQARSVRRCSAGAPGPAPSRDRSG